MLDRLEPVGTHGVGLVPLCWPCEVVGSGSSLAAVICGGDSGVNTADAPVSYTHLTLPTKRIV